MIIGLGSDIVNIERIAKLLAKSPAKFKSNYFTDYEVEAVKRYNPDNQKKISAHFAKRFAAKEAFSKAVGTGFGQHLSHKDIGIENDALGKPLLIPNSRATLLLKNVSGGKEVACHVSLSDDYPYAQSVVILEVVEML